MQFSTMLLVRHAAIEADASSPPAQYLEKLRERNRSPRESTGEREKEEKQAKAGAMVVVV